LSGGMSSGVGMAMLASMGQMLVYMAILATIAAMVAKLVEMGDETKRLNTETIDAIRDFDENFDQESYKWIDVWETIKNLFLGSIDFLRGKTGWYLGKALIKWDLDEAAKASRWADIPNTRRDRAIKDALEAPLDMDKIRSDYAEMERQGKTPRQKQKKLEEEVKRNPAGFRYTEEGIPIPLDPAVAAAVTTTDAPAAAAPVQQLPIGPGGGVKVDPMALKVEVVLKGEGQFMERIAKSSEVRAAISNATRSRQRASYGDFR